jgi:hypothetical protein
MKHSRTPIVFACVLAAALSCHPGLHAQFFQYGQDPARLQWNRLDSEKFRIIYPAGLDTSAVKLLGVLNRQYLANSAQLDHYPGKFPIILHNQTVNSNGFVSWAPRRSEFFTHPDINGYSQEWLTQLAIHEYRHVVQTDKLNQGLTRFFTTVLGEQGIGPTIAQVPFWFLEGDAVYAETSLSETGRGRLPYFEMDLKAQLLTNKKPYSFSKSYLGSYRDYVPDYYTYGYQMVSYAREKYGNDIWTGALRATARNFLHADPISYHLKKQAGITKNGLHKETMQHLETHWSSTATERTIADPIPLETKKRRTFTSYTSPRFAADGSVLAVKAGFDHTERFVKISNDGTEETVFVPGPLASGRIAVKGDKILWDEYLYGAVWTMQSYSVLREHNMKTGSTRWLSLRSRYSSPAWSPSGDTIVAVETGTDNAFSLVFLSAEDGRLLGKAPSPGNAQLQYPCWIHNSGKIASVAINKQGKSLLLYNRDSNSWTTLLEARWFNLSDPVSHDNRIFFNASFTGIDEIYSFDLETHGLEKITSARFGAFQPGIDSTGSLVTFAFYTNQGYSLATVSADHGTPFTPDFISPVTEQPFFRYNDATVPEIPAGVSPPAADYRISRYPKLTNLFNLHSWSPFCFDYTDPNIDNPGIYPGVTLLSQNLLSTAVSSLGYAYEEGNHLLQTRFIYKGMLPFFELAHTWGGPAPLILNSGAAFNGTVPPNSRLSLKTWLPLNFSAGKWVSGMQPSLTLQSDRSIYYYPEEKAYISGITYLTPRLYFYNYLRTSYRELQPRLGLVLDGLISFTPFEDEIIGSRTTLRAHVYAPGIMKNHGIKLQTESQSQSVENYVLGNSLVNPRGYLLTPAVNLRKYTADYVFPLAYPDLELGPLFYLSRIKAGLFADYVEGRDVYIQTQTGRAVVDRNYLSYGAEVYADYHLFRFLVPFSSGLRLVYTARDMRWSTELLFSFDLDSFR